MAQGIFGKCNTGNREVIAWVEEQTKLCQPDQVFWCDGSEAERDRLVHECLNSGELEELNP